jgi:hypothetical protein
MTLQLTVFPDVHARRAKRVALDWPALVRRLEGLKPAASKARCPLIKLGTFGDQRTAAGSLRSDHNLVRVFGVEGDYDDGAVSVDDAVLRLERAGLRALVYTSPSHTDDKPRWRVLAPLSREYPPGERNRFLARVNGALGGILASESFALSQTYYIGPVVDRKYLVVPTFDDPTEGRCVDECDELDEIAMQPAKAPNGAETVAAADTELLDAIRYGTKYHESLVSLAARYVGRGMAPADATAALQALMDESKPAGPDLGRWQERRNEIPRIVAGAAAKFTRPENPNAPAANGASFIGLASFISAAAAPRFVVRPAIQGGYLHAMTALTNHGKTALAQAMAIAVGAEKPFAGLPVSGGRVLYLCGENPEDQRIRFLALCEQRGIAPADLENRLYVRDGADRLGGIVDEIIAQANAVGEFALVVVDTSAAFFSYEDENDNVQARQHAQDCRRLTQISGGPAVLVLCHPVKGAASPDQLQPRGGGGFLNEIDTNLTLWNDGEVATLGHTKLRGPGFEPLAFRFEGVFVETVKDADGQPVRSVVAVALTDDEEARWLAKRTGEENAVLMVVAQQPEASIADWARALQWVGAADGQPLKSKVHRILSRLAADKLVARRRGRWRITSAGRDEAGR